MKFSRKPLTSLTLATTALIMLNGHRVLANETEAPLNVDPETTVEAISALLAEVEETPASTTVEETPAAAIEKLSLESNAIINTPALWESNYKGEGTIVAVIDSGLDVEHEVLRLSDVSKAKYKSEEELNTAKEKAGITYGKWYNDKVVFGYNYTDVNVDLKELDDAESHGMHVSGISVGNPPKDTKEGQPIYGVAPEAQLMFMRVFSEKYDPGTTSSYLYATAIRDAVKLGADSINLSLGGANGSALEVGDEVNSAIEFARKSGVSIVIAAGNDRVFGKGHANPLATNPDYGVVGNPAVARDSIAVAAFNNTHVISEVMSVKGLENDAELNNGNVAYARPSVVEHEFEVNKEYEYEFVGFGREEDVADKDLTGKVALIKRGEITFIDKIVNVKAKGAIGAIVFNHTPKAPLSIMTLTEGDATAIPSVYVSNEIGEKLASDSSLYKIVFSDKKVALPNAAANEMSDFTSWGLSSDGELKPDLAAPGGSIYASINDNQYANMSGTSMAAPHVAGAVAILKQGLLAKGIDLRGEALEQYIKHVLMSTANPHLNTDAGAYTSPRQQGAGIIDLGRALATDLYVTGEDLYGSLSLGNVEDEFTFNVVVHNCSNKERELNYRTHLTTDNVENGRFTLTPRALSTSEATKVVVPANGTKTIAVTVSAKEFTEELSELMPNGYFLEGFVRFTDTKDDSDVVSIPFVGFKGEFQNLPVLEKPIYDFDKSIEWPFYYIPEKEDMVEGEQPYNEEGGHYTSLNTDTVDGRIVLGTYLDEEGRDVIVRGEDGQPIFAISPDGDGNKDNVILRAVLLRNATNLKIAVYAEDDADFKTPLWETEPTDANKNHYAGRPTNKKSYVIDDEGYVWTGTDAEGNDLPDGTYHYVVSAYSDVQGSKIQRTVFKVIVDRKIPDLKDAEYDATTRTFKFEAPTDELSGVFSQGMFYMKKLLDAEGNEVEERVYIEPNSDGSYTVPETDIDGNNLKLRDVSFEVFDHAGNGTVIKADVWASFGTNSAALKWKFVDADSGEEYQINHRLQVTDLEGKQVDDAAYHGYVYKVPYGEYNVSLFLFDSDNYELVGETTQRVMVDKDNSQADIEFKVRPRVKASTRVTFNVLPPEGVRVFLVDEAGNRIELPQGRYDQLAFEKRVLTGKYTIAFEMAGGYLATGETADIEILGNAHNLKAFFLAAKGNLAMGGSALVQPELPEYDLSADDDNDGYTNEEELLANTDPTDSDSFPIDTAVPADFPTIDLPEIELNEVPTDFPTVDLPEGVITEVPVNFPTVDLPDLAIVVPKEDDVPMNLPKVDLPEKENKTTDIGTSKEVPSSAPVTKATTATALPATGDKNLLAVFGMAVLSILSGLGIALSSRQKD